MKKILVTGGFGFIGTTLVDLLLQDKNNKVHVVDDMSTASIDINDYISQITNSTSLSYDITTVEKFFTKDTGPGDWDEIYHLASPVGPAGVLKHAGNMVREVVRDAYLISDYCLIKNIKFLDVSTSEIYGGGQSGYCPESTPKIVPAVTTVRLEYAIAKLAAETAIINTCRAKNLKCTIIRPFNVSGPRQSPKGGFVLPRFIQQAVNNKPITVFNDGSAVRAFTHVKDMARGIILGMNNGKIGEAYNIGNPANKTTILDLAQRVIKVLSSKSEIIFVDPKTIYGETYEEANDKFPDAEKAKLEIGWLPEFDIDRTILDASNEYQRQLNAGVLKHYI
jgi:nucleoside-diphosphate-sugar epimerase